MIEKPFHWPGRRSDNPAHDMLVAFLVMDIQHNPEWAHELADKTEQVKSGSLPEWERIGNAYRLELTDQRALIEDLVDEDSLAQEITLENFCMAVKAWIEGIPDRP
jgi:hypothetical protein